MNIIFFGSDPWFSEPVLEAILKAKHQVALIVTKGDALKNFRFQISDFRFISDLRFMEVKTEEDITKKKMVRWLDGCDGMKSFRHLNNPNTLYHSPRPDAIVLAAFGPPFLPAEVLKWPKYGCLNVHASLLPRWRGASPVFAALAAGDKETGVSIMRMTEEIDRGPVLGQAGFKISQPDIIRPGLATQGRAFTDYDNRESLTRRLGILGGELIVETLKKLENGQITDMPQPEKSPTPYTRRLTKDSGRIDWRFRPGETSPERSRRIERFIRAVTPRPGAQTRAKFRIQNSRLQAPGAPATGGQAEFRIDELKILKVHLELIQYSVFSIQYSLVIDLVQLSGKNPISWKQFLAGHPGAKLE